MTERPVAIDSSSPVFRAGRWTVSASYATLPEAQRAEDWLIGMASSTQAPAATPAPAVGASVQPVLASLSDEQIDKALHELSGVATEYDVHEYGLPLHDDGELHRMRSVIRALASSTPTKGGEAS